MKRLVKGDVFMLTTDHCLVLLHYVHNDERIGQMVRVFAPTAIGDEGLELNEIMGSTEDFVLFFPLKAAIRAGVVRKVDHVGIPQAFSIPKQMRTKHVVGGKLQGWYIVDVETWHREFVNELSSDQIRLSPWGIWNDSLLVDRVCSGWSLENWR